MSLCYNDLIVCSLSRLLKELRELPIRALKETLKQFVAPFKRKWHSRQDQEIRDWLANGEIREGYRKSERRDEG